VIKQAKKGFTLIELMIVVAIIGILAAIAIPNFIKFQARSKQSEVKANLKAVYTAQKAYMQEKDAYSDSIDDIGFSPERGNRYAYYVGGTSSCRSRAGAGEASNDGATCITVDTFRHTGAEADPDPAFTEVGMATVSGTQIFTAAASGNIDNDSVLDQWSISSESRASGGASTAATAKDTGVCAAENNPAGAPCQDQNDV